MVGIGDIQKVIKKASRKAAPVPSSGATG